MTRIIRTGWGPSSASRPSSDLWVRQANAPGHSESISCAHQLCRCPEAGVILRIPTARIKMTRNGRSRP
eukprot:7573327-Pyramimonas_sp.AAC.1